MLDLVECVIQLSVSWNRVESDPIMGEVVVLTTKDVVDRTGAVQTQKRTVVAHDRHPFPPVPVHQCQERESDPRVRPSQTDHGIIGRLVIHCWICTPFRKYRAIPERHYKATGCANCRASKK